MAHVKYFILKIELGMVTTPPLSLYVCAQLCMCCLCAYEKLNLGIFLYCSPPYLF